MDFREECEEWLKPLGYTLFASNGIKTTLTFTDIDLPSISCYLKGERKYCIINDNIPYKLFLNLTTGELQFKHPDIKQYIEVFKHYGSLAKKYPPF